MNETLRRELARLEEYNTSPSTRHPRRRNKRPRSTHGPTPPPAPQPAPHRDDVRVELSTRHESVQHQIVALREEVNSLRVVLQRIFRTGVSGLEHPM